MALALLAIFSVGLFGRDFWTPDEPREADLAWRMSIQRDKAVPLLAGEPFVEKPPLTYWLAGGSIGAFGLHPWAARLPNLLYALITALGLGMLARRAIGPPAGPIAAACGTTFLLAYQVAIWLATDAPLLAFNALALLGLWIGYHAERRGERLLGYGLMHAALGLGFLSKSAAAWMVPVLTLVTLAVWERRWRELLRWELYAPLIIQVALIAPWVAAVYRGPDGLEHLRVFFWNNLAGRFMHLQAPAAVEYTSGHRNSPGKYLIELPMYLWPWTLIVLAALRRAWRERGAAPEQLGAVRFALASTLPTLLVLSLAATARNIYLAPALPGFALLVAWWWQGLPQRADRVDAGLVYATVAWLAVAVVVGAVAVLIVGADAAATRDLTPGFVLLAVLGLATSTALLAVALRGRELRPSLVGAAAAWCVLLVSPALPLYGQIDRWQDLAQVGRRIAADAEGRTLILLAPDETTRAFIDLYARRSAIVLIPAPLDAAAARQLQIALAAAPDARLLVQLPGREITPTLAAWAARLHVTAAARNEASPSHDATAPGLDLGLELGLTEIGRYALPNGRRYALLGTGH